MNSCTLSDLGIETTKSHVFKYYICKDIHGNLTKEWIRILLKNQEIQLINNFETWNENILFSSEKEIIKFIKNNL